MIYESAAKQRSEIQETIKQLKAQIDLSTAMAREAEDETYAFRVRVCSSIYEAHISSSISLIVPISIG